MVLSRNVLEKSKRMTSVCPLLSTVFGKISLLLLTLLFFPQTSLSCCYKLWISVIVKSKMFSLSHVRNLVRKCNVKIAYLNMFRYLETLILVVDLYCFCWASFFCICFTHGVKIEIGFLCIA